MSIPSTMRAAQLTTYDDGLNGIHIEEIPTPQPGPGEVLIKMAASPINPSDLMYIQGKYGFRNDLPTVPGFEGSGEVVAAGSGLFPKLRMGKRVGFAAQGKQGTWAEYVTAPALQCIVVPDEIDIEQASMMVVNPVTAWSMINDIEREGAKGVVINAAGGALGGMFYRYGRKKGLQVVNVVRRAEQVDQLKAEGREHVLCSRHETFTRQLKAICKQHDIQHAFDAVGGPATDQLAWGLPRGSRITIYGGLSEQPSQVDVTHLIFRNIVVDGYWATRWADKASLLTMLKVNAQVPRMLSDELATPIRARFGLDDITEALYTYAEQMSGGKVLIIPAEGG